MSPGYFSLLERMVRALEARVSMFGRLTVGSLDCEMSPRVTRSHRTVWSSRMYFIGLLTTAETRGPQSTRVVFG